MRDFVIPRPAFGFILLTRVALGVGIGLLMANRLNRAQRHSVGTALLAIGGGTTIPAIAIALGGARRLLNA